MTTTTQELTVTVTSDVDGIVEIPHGFGKIKTVVPTNTAGNELEADGAIVNPVALEIYGFDTDSIMGILRDRNTGDRLPRTTASFMLAVVIDDGE